MTGGEVSDLLLQLHNAARGTDIELFQRHAMEILRTEVQYDGCWWGRLTTDGETVRTYCSFLEGYPSDAPERLNTEDPRNLLARRTLEGLFRTHYFGLREINSEPATKALSEYFGFTQCLSIAHAVAAAGHVNFVVLSRRSEVPAFMAADCKLLEWLMPHLVTALDTCCARHIASLRTGPASALLAADSEGWIHVTETAVAELLQREWPRWSGPRLPTAMASALMRRPHRFLGRHVQAEANWAGEHLIVRLRGRKPIDLLTNQERAVAEAFTAGRPYKEVAELLQLAPSTVRHHLRNVYLKLGVGNKTTLARVMSD